MEGELGEKYSTWKESAHRWRMDLMIDYFLLWKESAHRWRMDLQEKESLRLAQIRENAMRNANKRSAAMRQLSLILRYLVKGELGYRLEIWSTRSRDERAALSERIRKNAYVLDKTNAAMRCVQPYSYK